MYSMVKLLFLSIEKCHIIIVAASVCNLYHSLELSKI